MEEGAVAVEESPAGMIFSSIAPEKFLTVKQGGYEIIDTPPLQHAYKCYTRRTRRPRSGHSSYSACFDERRLRIMANSGFTEMTRDFLEHNPHVDAIINKADAKRRTALHFAASRGSDEIVGLLLQHGADPNVKDFNGNSPLHLAACTHHIRVITLLLRYGADVKACDAFGKTPLHLALSKLRFLKRRDTDTYNAMKAKSEVGEIVSMLQEYLAKSGIEQSNQLDDITSRLQKVNTDQDMDEVGDLLANFTQMTIDAVARSKMPEE